jgi:hypothetical protein
MPKRLYFKYPLFLLDFNKILIFSADFRGKKGLKYEVSSKSVQWQPSCSMRTDRQTDGYDDANSSFLQFFERARISVFIEIIMKCINALCEQNAGFRIGTAGGTQCLPSSCIILC